MPPFNAGQLSACNASRTTNFCGGGRVRAFGARTVQLLTWCNVRAHPTAAVPTTVNLYSMNSGLTSASNPATYTGYTPSESIVICPCKNLVGGAVASRGAPFISYRRRYDHRKRGEAGKRFVLRSMTVASAGVTAAIWAVRPVQFYNYTVHRHRSGTRTVLCPTKILNNMVGQPCFVYLRFC